MQLAERWNAFTAILLSRWFLQALFVVNLFGTLYGYYWYKEQLSVTPWKYLIFVPDSPTASLFFTLVLFLYLINKRSPLLEAFAAITLLKYGVWAVVMILWGAILAPVPWLESLTWQHWMLIGSHLGMALQGILYFPYYTFRKKEILIVSAWTLLNDFLDYSLNIHPWFALELEKMIPVVAFFTVLLSLTSIFLFAILSMLPSKFRLWEYPILFKAKRQT